MPSSLGKVNNQQVNKPRYGICPPARRTWREDIGWKKYTFFSDRWTVHGIWPSVKKGPLGPFNCNNSIHFDPKSLDPIKERLNIQWTDVHKNAQKDDFWRHEWTKHGTCAIQLEPINTELKYFSKGNEKTFLIAESNPLKRILTPPTHHSRNMLSFNAVSNFKLFLIFFNFIVQFLPF